MRTLAPLGLSAALALSPLPVAAGPAEAEALLQQAEAAMREGDPTRAVLFLEQAYAADPDPRYVANLGVVYERSGQYAAAAAAFERYLATDPDPSRRTAAASALARLRPEGLIVSRPPGARVVIDGLAEPVGEAPVRTRLLAGPHTVRVSLDGYLDRDAALSVEPGAPFQLEVELEPRPVDPGADRRRAGWLTLGGGALGLAAAGGLAWATVDALAERDRLGDLTADDPPAAAEFRAAQNRANLFGWSAAATGAVGLVGVGLGLWMVTADDAAGIGRVDVGPAGARISGRF